MASFFYLIFILFFLAIGFGIHRGFNNRKKFSFRSKTGRIFLETEISQWQQEGLISLDQAQAIVNRYQASTTSQAKTEAQKKNRIVKILSAFGIVLFAVGCVMFVAANYKHIPDWLQVSLLIILDGLVYFLGWYFKEQRKNHPQLGQALILLGSLLFGVSLILIARIYHIQIEYSNLILLWTLGVLPLAYLTKLLPLFLLSQIGCFLWGVIFPLSRGGSVALGSSGQFNAVLPLLLLIYFPLSYLAKFPPLFIFNQIFCILWGFLSLWGSDFGQGNFTWQFYALLPLLAGLYIPWAYFLKNRSLQALNLTSVFVWLGLVGGLKWFREVSFPAVIICLLFLGVGLFVSFLAQLHNRWERGRIFSDLYSAFGSLLVLFSTFLLSFPQIYEIGRGTDPSSFWPILFNFVLFGEICLAVYLGVRQGEEYFINFGVVFFGLLVLARYFTLTWSFSSKSLVFIFGGVILLAGSYLLEKLRKKFIQQIQPASKNEL